MILNVSPLSGLVIASPYQTEAGGAGNDAKRLTRYKDGHQRPGEYEVVIFWGVSEALRCKLERGR